MKNQKQKRKYHLKTTHKDTLNRKKRNGKIYHFYLNFLLKKGRIPTLEEIGERFGFSRARAGQVLERLAREDYLLKLEKYHRSYLPKDIIIKYNKGQMK